MFLDGQEDAYDRSRAIGSFAEDTSQHCPFIRDTHDKYALLSRNRVRAAIVEGRLYTKIVPVDGVAVDEQLGRGMPKRYRCSSRPSSRAAQ